MLYDHITDLILEKVRLIYIILSITHVKDSDDKLTKLFELFDIDRGEGERYLKWRIRGECTSANEGDKHSKKNFISLLEILKIEPEMIEVIRKDINGIC